MSWTNTNNNNFSDEILDTIGEAMEKVAELYAKDLKRKPTVSEIENILDMVIGGNPNLYINDGEKIRIKSVCIDYIDRKSLQKLSVGDVIKARLKDGLWVFGRIFEISDQKGTLLGVYDSRGLSVDQLDFKLMPFCLKAQNVSDTSLDEDSEWVFVKSSEIMPDEIRPNPPKRLSLSSLSGTLLCANYFYNLMDDDPPPYMKKNFEHNLGLQRTPDGAR